MVPPEYADQLRCALSEGKSLDQAFSELRAAGAGPIAAIRALRFVRGGSLVETKRAVNDSPVWQDRQINWEEAIEELAPRPEP